jgi:hypothetical protein
MTMHKAIPLLLGLATAVTGVLVAASPAAAVAGGIHIESVNTNETGGAKCLQPVGASLDAGAAIIQTYCDFSSGNLAQQWASDDLGGGVVHYRNLHSNLCLDARGGATNGTPVQQWACNTISNERWQPVIPDIDPDTFDGPVISRVSGTSSLCLDVPGASPADRLAMQIWQCNGTTAQDWSVIF